MGEQPEWVDVDNDETEVDVIDQEPGDDGDDVPDDELAEVELSTPANLAIEGMMGDDR